MYTLMLVMPNGLVDVITVYDTKPNQYNGTTEIYPVGSDKFEIPTNNIISLTEIIK